MPRPTMEQLHDLYAQKATHFTLQFFIDPNTEVPGTLFIELAETFLSRLIFPGCRISSLDIKRPGAGAKLQAGDYSHSRWRAVTRKLRAGQCAIVGITAHTADFPNQQIRLLLHLNPPGGTEFLVAGEIALRCSIPYLRHIDVSPEKIDALVEFGRRAWNGVAGGPAYGFGNLAITLARAPFQPWTPRPPGAPLPWDFLKPPVERAHAIPIAYVGNDVDGSLASLYCTGAGIKGAFWANYLSARHVVLAGGDMRLRRLLPEMRIESLEHGGLMIVSTENPLPPDTDENRDRFLRLDAALRPAFLSREDMAEGERSMLGYFYRERS